MDLFNNSNAVFSPCRKYRYVLTRVWDTSKFRVAFIGLNPSTANESKDDPTIRRVVRFAQSMGAGGVFMLNLFALVTPYPNELKQAQDPIGENDDYLLRYTMLSDKIIFCWGNFDVFGRDKEVIAMFPNAMCLGKNSNGSPKHPLYLKADTLPVPFCANPHISGKQPDYETIHAAALEYAKKEWGGKLTVEGNSSLIDFRAGANWALSQVARATAKGEERKE